MIDVPDHLPESPHRRQAFAKRQRHIELFLGVEQRLPLGVDVEKGRGGGHRPGHRRRSVGKMRRRIEGRGNHNLSGPVDKAPLPVLHDCRKPVGKRIGQVELQGDHQVAGLIDEPDTFGLRQLNGRQTLRKARSAGILGLQHQFALLVDVAVLSVDSDRKQGGGIIVPQILPPPAAWAVAVAPPPLPSFRETAPGCLDLQEQNARQRINTADLRMYKSLQNQHSTQFLPGCARAHGIADAGAIEL